MKDMKRHAPLVVCLVATLFTVMGFAHAASAQADITFQESTSSPVAYAYVSSTSNQKTHAFAVASDGTLTPVSGSPFRTGYALSLAANAKYLFSSDRVYIYSYAIASDGAIKQVASIDAQQYNPGNIGGPVFLFPDRTGATLYDTDYYCCGSENAYQFFGVDNANGVLSYLGVTTAREYFLPLSFIGNNVYAYAAQCSQYWSILGFQRNNDGTLTDLNINPPVPVAPKGYWYCPEPAVADSTNHVAIVLTPTEGYRSSQAAPPPQLATYTADGSGNLSTNSTRFNMPRIAVKGLTDMAMSPSGKLLAVSGTAGFEVFHFNGSKPITHYTGLLAKDQIDQLYWDDHDHLFATSLSASKLYVFTITPKSVSQAPGSPHRITKPESIVVFPKK
jgi:hypothetical protein